MITVIRTDGTTEPFDRQRIVDALVKETKLCEDLFGTEGIDKSRARVIAVTVEKVLTNSRLETVTSHAVREVMCSVLLSFANDYNVGHEYRDWYRVCTRVGMSVFDAWEIDHGSGFEAHDNANLKPNAETSHKKKADKLSKEQNLLLLPQDLAFLHQSGDFHIHDLEYFGTRPFCADSDLRYLFYYGLVPSGDSSTSAVAKPAQNAEVAILHAVKWMGSAQTNFAGGQGFYNFLTFLSPYLADKEYKEIRQLMQMFVYEMVQMYVARGGQTVFSSVQLSPGVPKIWRDKPVVAKGKVYNNITYWDFEPYVRMAFKALMEVMLEGDANGKPFNFPKPEIAIEPCFVEPDEWVVAFDKDTQYWLPTYEDLYKLAFELAAKFGTPYFDNMLPAYRGAGEGISCYQCIPEFETVHVKTANGSKIVPISAIDTDDEILTPTGFSNFADMLVHPFSGELNRVTLVGGRTVYMTDDHELNIMRKGEEVKVTARDLNASDKLKVLTWLPTDGDAIEKAMDIFGVDHRNINDFAYLMGLYCAEGNILIRDTRTGGHRMQISLGIGEINYRLTTVDILERVFGVVPKVKEIRGNECRILVYSKEFCKKFIDSGVPEKTSSGWVPDFMFSAPVDAKWNFLQGYFDGDGTISNVREYTRICMYSMSKELMDGISLLLQSLGINPTFACSTRGLHQLSIAVWENIHRFVTHSTQAHDNYAVQSIRSLERVQYSGLVYDPVNVDGHEFVNGQGIVIGNCCAYQFSSTIADDPEFEDKMYFRNGKHFSMGSWMVITINCPRAGYIANIRKCDEEDFYTDLLKILKGMMDSAVDIFKVKQDWMRRLINEDRIPFATQQPVDPCNPEKLAPFAIDLDSYVYTIGVVGIDDMVAAITGNRMHEDKKSLELGLQVIYDLKEYSKELSEKTGLKIALARTPAETTAQRFAVCDLRDPWYSHQARNVVHGDIEYAMEHLSEADLPVYYSNGTHVPPDVEIDLPDRLNLEGKFFSILDGGNIAHIWLGEAWSNPEGLYDFGMRLAKNTDIGYFAFTKDFTVCSACGSVEAGLQDWCGKCGSLEIDHISRITGYLSNVSAWNAGKRQELKDRSKVVILK